MLQRQTFAKEKDMKRGVGDNKMFVIHLSKSTHYPTRTELPIELHVSVPSLSSPQPWISLYGTLVYVWKPCSYLLRFGSFQLKVYSSKIIQRWRLNVKHALSKIQSYKQRKRDVHIYKHTHLYVYTKCHTKITRALSELQQEQTEQGQEWTRNNKISTGSHLANLMRCYLHHQTKEEITTLVTQSAALSYFVRWKDYRPVNLSRTPFILTIRSRTWMI